MAAIIHHAWSLGERTKLLLIKPTINWICDENQLEIPNLRLDRILKVPTDLKDLCIVLNKNDFIFNIDSALYASQHGFLELKIWIADRINEHGVIALSICQSNIN